MTDNSDAEKTLTSPKAVPHIRRFVRWAGSVVVLIGLVVLATRLAYRGSTNWFLPLGLAAIAILAVLILWKLPQWQVAQVRNLEPKERFDRVNEARKTLATILGGIALLAGFFGTWQNLQLAQEGQITDRFTKAIEQLGASYPDGKPKLDVRLGGIYALERIANDSERDHWPIMEVLCTYVREHARVTGQDQGEQPPTTQPMSTDIQAILTVLGRRDTKYEKSTEVLNLRQTNLFKADLNEAHLTRADLGGADLSGADLTRADLSKADFLGADLRGSHLFGANLNFAKNLTQEQIDDAVGDSTTILPYGLHMPESWNK